jgi:type II secretory pathway component PulK
MPRQDRRGTILIVTMIVVFALAGMVLALCRSMRVEMITAANQAAGAQADAVERAGEQYMLGVLTTEGQNVTDLAEDQFAGIPVGDGYFWVLRPDYGDASFPAFGPVAESAKLNINTASYDQLLALPNMTDEIAAGILDWRGSAGQGQGAFGGSIGQGYVKQSAFESVEELMMVSGMRRQLLYGDGTAPPLGQHSSQINFGGSSMGGGSSGSGMGASGNLLSDPVTARGWYDLLTIYTAEANTAADGSARVNLRDRGSDARSKLQNLLNDKLGGTRGTQIVAQMGRDRPVDVFEFARKYGLTASDLDKVYDYLTVSDANTVFRNKINVTLAPRDVLLCIRNLSTGDVDKLISTRQSVNPAPAEIGWVLDALGSKAEDIGNQVTVSNYQWSADILAVSGNGRMFKRVRVVIDTRNGTPAIIYRRDLTDRGWPMDKQILASMRAGNGPGNYLTGVGNGMGMGSSSLGGGGVR